MAVNIYMFFFLYNPNLVRYYVILLPYLLFKYFSAKEDKVSKMALVWSCGAMASMVLMEGPSQG